MANHKENLRDLSVILGSHGSPLSQVLMPLVEILTDHEERLGGGEESLNGLNGRFADMDAKELKGKNRERAMKLWNSAYDAAGDRQKEIGGAAAHIKDAVMKHLGDGGTDEDFEDLLIKDLNAIEDEGGDPVNIMLNVAKELGYSYEEVADKAEDKAKGEDTDDEGIPAEGDKEPEADKEPEGDKNPDAEEVIKASVRTPDTAGSSSPEGFNPRKALKLSKGKDMKKFAAYMR